MREASKSEVLIKELELFNLYSQRQYKYFFQESEKLKLFSAKREYVNLNGVKEVLSIILYSPSLDKVFLIPCCAVLVNESKYWLPEFLQSYTSKIEKFVKKAIRRIPPSTLELFYVPPDINWIREEINKLDRYYICLNDLPTGIHHIKRYRYVLKFVNALFSKSNRYKVCKILELGHGMGYFLNLFGENFKYEAYDIDEKVRNLARKINLSNAKVLERLPDLERYDVILSLETMAHIPNPFQFTKNVLERGTENTLFIFSLPEEEYGGSHLNCEHVTNWNARRVKRFFSFFFEKIQVKYQKAFDFQSKNWFSNSEIEDEFLPPEEVESYLVFAERKREKVDFSDIIVVKRTFALGDSLLAEPVIRKFKKLNPDKILVYVTNFTQIFKKNPDIDILAKNSYYGKFSDFKPPLGAKIFDLDFSYEKNPHESIIKNYCRICKTTLCYHESCPQVYLGNKEMSKMSVFLQNLNEPYLVCFNIGKKYNFSRTLHPDIVKLLVDFIYDKFKSKTVFIGSPMDFSPFDYNLPSKKVIDLVGKTDIMDVALLLSYADLLLSPDTGVMHIAASVNCPTIAFFGMALPKNRIDYKNLIYPVVPSLNCVGCLHSKFTIDPKCHLVQPNEYPPCMTQLPVEQIFNKISSILPLKESYKWKEKILLCRGQE